MHVRIISPERSVFDGEASSVMAPAFDGQVGILPKHAPFMTLLGEGRLTLELDSGVRAFRVRGGFLQVLTNTVSVVTEEAADSQKGV